MENGLPNVRIRDERTTKKNRAKNRGKNSNKYCLGFVRSMHNLSAQWRMKRTGQQKIKYGNASQSTTTKTTRHKQAHLNIQSEWQKWEANRAEWKRKTLEFICHSFEIRRPSNVCALVTRPGSSSIECMCEWAKEASLNAYICREQYTHWTLVGIFRRRVTAYSQMADLMYG